MHNLWYPCTCWANRRGGYPTDLFRSLVFHYYVDWHFVQFFWEKFGREIEPMIYPCSTRASPWTEITGLGSAGGQISERLVVPKDAHLRSDAHYSRDPSKKLQHHQTRAENILKMMKKREPVAQHPCICNTVNGHAPDHLKENPSNFPWLVFIRCGACL